MHPLVTFVAKYFLILPLILAAIVWLRLKNPDKRRFIILAAISGILTLVFAKIGSKLFYDPRPFVSGHFTPYFAHGNDNGFPSDHTLLSSWLGFLTLSYNRTYGWLALGLAALIGAARVIAGIHHVVDIVGSFICAAVAVGIVYQLVVARQRQQGSPSHDETNA